MSRGRVDRAREIVAAGLALESNHAGLLALTRALAAR